MCLSGLLKISTVYRRHYLSMWLQVYSFFYRLFIPSHSELHAFVFVITECTVKIRALKRDKIVTKKHKTFHIQMNKCLHNDSPSLSKTVTDKPNFVLLYYLVFLSIAGDQIFHLMYMSKVMKHFCWIITNLRSSNHRFFHFQVCAKMCPDDCLF